jgi:hypothetical protein
MVSLQKRVSDKTLYYANMLGVPIIRKSKFMTYESVLYKTFEVTGRVSSLRFDSGKFKKHKVDFHLYVKHPNGDYFVVVGTDSRASLEAATYNAIDKAYQAAWMLAKKWG